MNQRKYEVGMLCMLLIQEKINFDLSAAGSAARLPAERALAGGGEGVRRGGPPRPGKRSRYA